MSTVAVGKVAVVSMDFLGLETRLDSLVPVILVLVVVELTLRVPGHHMQCAASGNLSSGSIFGMGGKALLSTGGVALLSTGAAGSTGTLVTHTSGLGPRNSGDSTTGLKFLK